MKKVNGYYGKINITEKILCEDETTQQTFTC